jgi:hypothetical protein
MMDEQSADYWASAVDWSIRTGRPNPGLCREKLDIKGLQPFKNNPKPMRTRIRGRGPRVPMNMASGRLLPILKKLLAEDNNRKKLAEKYEFMLSLDIAVPRLHDV